MAIAAAAREQHAGRAHDRVAQADPLQDPHQPHVRPVERGQGVQHHAQGDQRGRAPQHVADQRSFALPRAPRQRVRQRGAHAEQEGRKNHVREREAAPVRMGQHLEAMLPVARVRDQDHADHRQAAQQVDGRHAARTRRPHGLAGRGAHAHVVHGISSVLVVYAHMLIVIQCRVSNEFGIFTCEKRLRRFPHEQTRNDSFPASPPIDTILASS
jgi:hypothetical protein